MWRAIVSSLIDDAQFHPRVSDEALIEAERLLGVQLPEELKECLQESNGIEGMYLGLVWPLDRIVSENLHFRKNATFQEMYMPFDHLLFFAEAGNGDLFAYPIQGKNIHRPDIFVWDHESDSRSWVASRLSDYLKRWLSGDLGV